MNKQRSLPRRLARARISWIIFHLIVFVSVAGFLAYRLMAHEGHHHGGKAAPVFKQSIVNIEYKGTKVWVPSFLIVPKGYEVHLKLINDTPSGVHGFSIPDFNVKVEVSTTPVNVSFKADRTGLFPINCHIHPAHIGGQLYVVDIK